MKNNNKYIYIIFIAIVVIVTAVVTVLLLNKPKVKKYDVQAIHEQTIRAYDDMRKMDFIDTTTLFGINEVNDESSIFLTNIDLQKNITLDTNMIIVINTDNCDEYYNIFRSFLDSYYFNTDEKEMLDYLDKSILKKGNNYVYFLMGNDSKEYEKDINSFYY